MILQLLSQIILLSSLMIAGTQSQDLPKQDCPSKCGNVTIPFPFGIGTGCYIDDWFEIKCNSGKPFIRRLGLEVLEISLLNGTMRVNHPVSGSSANASYHTNSPYPNFPPDSPFVFSQGSNRFTGIGCNIVAFMSTDYSMLGGCFTICDGKKIRAGEKRCYGNSFCQTNIPSLLQAFNATIADIDVENEGKENKCKQAYAFLVDQHWFETELKNPDDVKKRNKVPVVLDWWIFKSSFDRFAKNKADGYKSTSDCKVSVNIPSNSTPSSTQFPAVRCLCLQGFEGNPYLLQGCQDIDECSTSNNICGEKKCKNTVGSHCYPRKPTINNNMIKGFGVGSGAFSLIILASRLYIVIKEMTDRKQRFLFFKQNGGLLLQQHLTSSDDRGDKSKIFKLKELNKATDHFNVDRKLGQGGQGTVYKGMLSDGRIVAVKKSKGVDQGQIHQFINEVLILSEINHRNVVKLLGCCLETEVPLLVYEFIPNGTLSKYIHDQNEEFPLTWDMRLRIATEVAGALSYLHSATLLPIYHRDIKSANILLDDKYRAKIADFGISRSMSIDQTHVTTKVQGTLGYIDPEFFQSSQFTEKSDVYSFGVVLAELLTGQRHVFSTSSHEARGLAQHFISRVEENILDDILDAQVKIHGRKEDIIAVANLTYRCLNQNGNERPTMKEVAMELERIRGLQNNNLQQNHEVTENVRRVSEEFCYASSSSASAVWE